MTYVFPQNLINKSINGFKMVNIIAMGNFKLQIDCIIFFLFLQDLQRLDMLSENIFISPKRDFPMGFDYQGCIVASICCMRFLKIMNGWFKCFPNVKRLVNKLCVAKGNSKPLIHCINIVLFLRDK